MTHPIIVIQNKIEDAGLRPQTCPKCKELTLWPKPHQARNALSRRKDEYVCDICGIDEAMEDYNSKK